MSSEKAEGPAEWTAAEPFGSWRAVGATSLRVWHAGRRFRGEIVLHGTHPIRMDALYDDELAARAWCDRWAAVLLREVVGGEAPSEPSRAEAIAAARREGAESVRDAALSVADAFACDGDEWAHELMERVATAVVRAGGGQ